MTFYCSPLKSTAMSDLSKIQEERRRAERALEEARRIERRNR